MSTAPFQLWPSMRRVENAAWNAILRCTKAKKLTEIPLPVPVEAWIEGPLGIHFGIADLSHLGADVLGVARAKEREIFVSETLVKHEARFRFTAAHELGHVLLHGRITGEFRETEDGVFLERKLEREADRFAASFLMPLPALCAEYCQAAATLWSDPTSLLLALTRHDGPAQAFFRSNVLPHLTKRFGVSVTAAVHRFSDVQLPTGEPAIPFEVGVQIVARELAQGSHR